MISNPNKNLASTKIDLLKSQYGEVRSHIKLLHRNSIALATIGIPALMGVTASVSSDSDFGYFIPLTPIIMAAVVAVLIYIRSASLVYMRHCREIEKKINKFVDDPSLFDFESKQRIEFDQICFHTWGPGRIMYVLIGSMSIAVYVYLCARSYMFLAQKLSSSVPAWGVVVIAGFVYTLVFVIVSLSARKTFKMWMDYVGKKALKPQKSES